MKNNKKAIAEGLKRAYSLLGTLNRVVLVIRSSGGNAMSYHLEEARKHLKQAFGQIDRL